MRLVWLRRLSGEPMMRNDEDWTGFDTFLTGLLIGMTIGAFIAIFVR